MGAPIIRDLAAAIIRDGKVPSDWEQSSIVCLFKGKGDAFLSVDDSQFGFVPGRGTTDAVVRQLQEKYLAAKRDSTWLL